MSYCMYFSSVTPSMEIIIVIITCAAVLEAWSGLRPFCARCCTNTWLYLRSLARRAFTDVTITHT